ncbi:probable carboxylesterase SOBER1-like [Dioscorea cayenensis subsp. rotundata]|uniref:Probable carboxylesterase SOBER1-like n=1 Tax=Dioscorea cayennensis subsp. rotundata TaxID=55577 RepID=A0AB40CIT4_DIOCR|nr:probable carboxylesterase SOBER1-like [Dioscorea cayenensis subsp. rotundata]
MPFFILRRERFSQRSSIGKTGSFEWNEEELPKNENDVLKAAESVHAMIDKEVAAGINPENIFVCGFSQGGALTVANVL